MTTFPEPKASRTGLARSATSDTLRTASVNKPAGSMAREPNSAGNLDRYLMNSPPISRAVSLRSPPSKLIMPSAGRGSRPGPVPFAALAPGSPPPNAIVTGTPAHMVRPRRPASGPGPWRPREGPAPPGPSARP